MITIREARPADAAGIARVHVESWRSTYRGLVPDAHLDGLSIEKREGAWGRALAALKPGEHYGVAEIADGQIVGWVGGGPERGGDPVYCGELYGICLLASHQRRGIGRRLVAWIVDRLMAEGFNTMLLWALEENAACRFYEALGGTYLRRQPVEIGGQRLEKVAYGWRDIRPLACDLPARTAES